MVLKRRLGKGDVSEEDSRHIPFYFGIRPFYFPIKMVSKNSEIHTVFQNGAFCILKVPVLQRKMVRFAMQNGAFCNAKWCVLQAITQHSGFKDVTNPLSDLDFSSSKAWKTEGRKEGIGSEKERGRR